MQHHPTKQKQTKNKSPEHIAYSVLSSSGKQALMKNWGLIQNQLLLKTIYYLGTDATDPKLCHNNIIF